MGDKILDPFPVHRKRQLLADLGNFGVWETIVGLVVGRPYAHDESMRMELEKVVRDACAGWGFPILLNVDVRHTSPMLTIPMHALCSLDSKGDTSAVLEAGVVEA